MRVAIADVIILLSLVATDEDMAKTDKILLETKIARHCKILMII